MCIFNVIWDLCYCLAFHVKQVHLCQTGWTIWEYFVLGRQFSYTIGGTTRSNTHDQREVLRRSICVRLVHDWQLRTNEGSWLWKEIQRFIFMHTRMSRECHVLISELEQVLTIFNMGLLSWSCIHSTSTKILYRHTQVRRLFDRHLRQISLFWLLFLSLSRTSLSLFLLQPPNPNVHVDNGRPRAEGWGQGGGRGGQASI